MKRKIIFAILAVVVVCCATICTLVLQSGGTKKKNIQDITEHESNQADIRLRSNPSTGEYYTLSDIRPNGIVRNTDSLFISDIPDDGMSAGASGEKIFLFEAISEGEAYIRINHFWREEIIYILAYKANVDNDMNLTITPVIKPDNIFGCWVTPGDGDYITEYVLHDNGRYYRVGYSLHDLDPIYETVISVIEGTYSIDGDDITFERDYHISFWYDGGAVGDLANMGIEGTIKEPGEPSVWRYDEESNTLRYINAHGGEQVLTAATPYLWWSFEHRAMFED